MWSSYVTACSYEHSCAATTEWPRLTLSPDAHARPRLLAATEEDEDNDDDDADDDADMLMLMVMMIMMTTQIC